MQNKSKQLQKGLRWKNLGEVCKIKKGTSITKSKVLEGNIPVIAGGQKLAYYHNVSNREGKTITISASGAYAGYINYFEMPIFASDCITIQSVDENALLTKYVYLFLRSKQKDIYYLQSGAGQPHVYAKDLTNIEILLPSINIQKRIVSILEKAEKLKKRRRKTNEETNKIIQSIFYEMFLSKKEKWKNYQLGELFEIVRGGSPRPIQKYLTKNENGINWIKIGDTKDDPKYIYKTEEKIKPEGLKKTRLVNEGDFILSNSMSFGRPYIVKTKGCVHDGWLIIRDINKKTNNDYLYSILSSNYVYSQFLGFISGSTVKNLKIGVVKKVIIPIPPIELQNKFAEQVKKIEKIKQHQQKSEEEINTLFNALMQKAFNGELVN